MVRHLFRISIVGAGLLLGLIALAPQEARADTDVTVNDTRDFADPSPNVGVCSSTANTCTLRAAIQRANHRIGTHTIRLPAGTFQIFLAARGEDDAEFGDFDIKGNIVIRGAGARSTFIDARGLDRVFDVRTGSLVLVDLTVRGGLAAGSDPDGGGIRAKSNLTLSRVHLHSNTSSGSGGGIWTDNDLSIVQSTIANNTSLISNGALVADSGLVLTRDISIRESTFSGNSRQQPAGSNNTGGAVRITGKYDVQILHSTFAFNSPGAINVQTFGNNNQLTIHHTLLSNNTLGPNCHTFTGYTDTDLQHNLDSDGTCGFSTLPGFENVILVDPLLGPLQNNGGQTNTIAFANPIVQGGTFSGPLCSGVDQRGLPRPVDQNGAPGGRCDIGAIELQGPVGIAALDPDNATFKKQEKFHLDYLWRVPPGENWHDIKSLDLRVRDDGDILIWLRWTEGADTFQLINPRSGKPQGVAVFAGTMNVLRTDDAELDARESSSQGSGPTGPEVTLHLALTFHKKSGPHDFFTIEVNAVNDKGQTQSFVALGAVTVR